MSPPLLLPVSNTNSFSLKYANILTLCYFVQAHSSFPSYFKCVKKCLCNTVGKVRTVEIQIPDSRNPDSSKYRTFSSPVFKVWSGCLVMWLSGKHKKMFGYRYGIQMQLGFWSDIKIMAWIPNIGQSDKFEPFENRTCLVFGSPLYIQSTSLPKNR